MIIERRNAGCKALMSAILAQAVSDAVSGKRQHDHVGAKRFIDASNQLFRMYCELLEYDPDWMAEKMQRAIKEHKLKPLMKLRK